jgi:protein TonB
MQVISGHPLLIPAALEALRKWKYEPTYLNDEPVPVRLLVTIKFHLDLR